MIGQLIAPAAAHRQIRDVDKRLKKRRLARAVLADDECDRRLELDIQAVHKRQSQGERSTIRIGWNIAVNRRQIDLHVTHNPPFA